MSQRRRLTQVATPSDLPLRLPDGSDRLVPARQLHLETIRWTRSAERDGRSCSYVTVLCTG